MVYLPKTRRRYVCLVQTAITANGCTARQYDLCCCCCCLSQVEVKDTVGCGDSFAAAIVLGYTRTHDVHATLLLANAVGAATAMGRGAGTNVADAQTVMKLLNEARCPATGSNNGTSISLHDLDNAITILQDSLQSVDEDQKVISSMHKPDQQACSPAHAA